MAGSIWANFARQARSGSVGTAVELAMGDLAMAIMGQSPEIETAPTPERSGGEGRPLLRRARAEREARRPRPRSASRGGRCRKTERSRAKVVSKLSCPLTDYATLQVRNSVGLRRLPKI